MQSYVISHTTFLHPESLLQVSARGPATEGLPYLPQGHQAELIQLQMAAACFRLAATV